MPTYTVMTANIELNREQKAKIADIVTVTHSRHTGAPAFFVQVFFAETRDGDHFIGGKINAAVHLFILGHIRAGRSEKKKRAIIEQLIEQTAAVLAIEPQDVWIYIQDIDAEQMAEFGRILPAPGEEAAWRNGLSDAKIKQLQSQGVDV